MLALILAGGEGTRLGMGEKPLVTICGRPMLAYVINAFTSAGLDVVVVGSRCTPMTLNYLRAQGVDFHLSAGQGYVEDIVEAATEADVKAPLFTSVADLPCLRPEHIIEIGRHISLRRDLPFQPGSPGASASRQAAERIT